MEKLVDMKQTKAQMRKANSPVAIGGNDYPWGLTLNLDAAALTKLGMKKLPEVGAECMIDAVGKVTRVSESAGEKLSSRNVEIQITRLALHHGDDEDGEKAFAKGFKKAGGRKGY